MLHHKISQRKTGFRHVRAVSPRSVETEQHPAARLWTRSIAATSVLLLIMLSLFVSGKQASAQQSATLRCRVESTTVTVDDSVTLFIEVVDVADLYGYELTLKFNGARVHFEDADPGKSGVNLQIGDFLSPDFIVLNTVDNSAGQATLALTQLSPSEAASGTGELARATLTGMASGVVSFSFSDVVLSDPAGVAIPVTMQGCNVEVTAGQSTPTPPPPAPDGDAVLVVEPDAAATLIYTGTNDLPITIEVPAGAVTDTITLVYTEGTTPSTAPLNLQFAGVHFWLDAYRNNVKLDDYVFQTPIQIELHYTGADVVGLAEESIVLYSFEQRQGGWFTDGIEVLERTVSGNRLLVSVAHLSEFATFTSASTNVDKGSISGIVFEDLNQNGINDLGEPGLRAVIKLYLLDSERIWTTLSKTDGTYIFRRLPDGEYFIEITPLVDTAFAYTTSATVNISVSEGSGVAGVDFGLALADQVWFVYLPATIRSVSVTGLGVAEATR